jgi:PAS domain S-box-containing protein
MPAKLVAPESITNLEMVLRMENDGFRFLANNLPQHFWIAIANGQLEYLNEKGLAYYGKSIQELVGDGWLKFVHPDDLPHMLRVREQALFTGTPYEVQIRLLKADGVYRWHLHQATPLTENGKLAKWVGTSTDIENQKKTELQKEDFLSVASHELRTPLTSAKAYLQLAQWQAEQSEKLQPLLTKSLQQIGRLQHLINNLLDVSKINAGKITYDVEGFRFDQLVQETADSMQQVSATHRIVVAENVFVEVKGDRLRLEQVLTNLLTNAIKYSPGADKVVVKSTLQQDNLVVSVQDFGIGIAQHNLRHLFDRYYRTDNTAMRYDGLGLGLYISAEIIKRHNGSFWIESELGQGSTFYFLLPLNGKQALTELATDAKTFYKANYLELYYNPSQQWIEANWLGYQNLESVQKGCLVMLNMLQKNNCSKVLNDNTHVMGNWSEASDWGAEFWFPAMQKAGLTHFAWIYSPSTFSRMAAHKSVDVLLGSITAQFFTDKQAAIAWLGNV